MIGNEDGITYVRRFGHLGIKKQNLENYSTKLNNLKIPHGSY